MGGIQVDGFEHLGIEPLTDDLLATVSGASSSGATCCSFQNCSHPGPPWGMA